MRVLDDFLQGGQNESVGYPFTHRPATLNKVSGTLRVLGETFGCNLVFCSDFSKAFKHIPAVESLQKYTVVVQRDPVRAKPVFMIPLTQSLGGLSTPLNFARCLAWCCHSLAALAAPVEHCVDDMLGSEIMQTIQRGWTL